MKGLHKIALLFAAVALMVSGLALAGDDAWFDMENCSFCKNLTTDPELLHHMTWDQYEISNGVISVTNVDPEYEKSYETCQAQMEKVAKEMQQGKQMPMCQSCMTLGAIMMKGLHTEQVKTKTGEIWIMTSDDPELVTGVQKWAARNMDEMAKMHAHEGQM
jgi:hypothetical protein